MVPLYAARIEDLGPGDLAKVECAGCGHYELIPASALLRGLRLAPTYLCSICSRDSRAESATRAEGRSSRSNGPRVPPSVAGNARCPVGSLPRPLAGRTRCPTALAAPGARRRCMAAGAAYGASCADPEIQACAF
jgi:hypothetical protein